ncbi:unnamed protein product [Cladocopium goreaui]|uniref:Uncharacterized protein n=1 Tax=Cladocopium goreaui TaxID=2562237 RepID=A0A9P1C377_9DINO|nr:unnamed protein product [Cladocopium goreaui]
MMGRASLAKVLQWQAGKQNRYQQFLTAKKLASPLKTAELDSPWPRLNWAGQPKVKVKLGWTAPAKVKKFSIGKLSALEVQEVASAAVKSGADNAEMRALQGLGGMGHARGNVHRDLVRKYFSLLLSPEPWEIQCPLAVKQGGHRIEKEASTHMLLPHLWVIEAQENNFLGNLCCKDEEIAAFWKSQMKSPQMTPELKQVIKTSQPSQLPVPYLLHGDAAPFTEVDSIQVLSFRCLLSSKAVTQSQMLISALPKLAMTKETCKRMMEVLAWSWQVLWDGVVPKKDKAGDPIEKHRGKRMRKGVLWSVSGDLEWFASEFGFPYSAANMLCPFCLADQFKEGSPRPFTDFRATAAWRQTTLPPAKLQKKFAGHPLFRGGGGAPHASALSIKLDILHVLDLGVAAYAHGSLLWSIMEELPGASRAVRLANLNQKVVEAYDKVGLEAQKRMKHLSLSDLAETAEEYPCLKHVKGAKIRYFAPAAFELAKEFNETKSGKHREALAKQLVKVYKILGSSWEYWDFEAFKKAVDDFMAHYSWLAANALHEGLHLWSLVQKSHVLLHLAEQSKFMHPCLNWTYGSESFMGWTVQIGGDLTHMRTAKFWCLLQAWKKMMCKEKMMGKEKMRGKEKAHKLKKGPSVKKKAKNLKEIRCAN